MSNTTDNILEVPADIMPHLPHAGKIWCPWPENPPEEWPAEYVSKGDFDVMVRRLADERRRIVDLRGFIAGIPCRCVYIGDGDTVECGRCAALENSSVSRPATSQEGSRP